MSWAQSIGPEVLDWVKAQLRRKEHPEQAYRVCLGLLSLSRSYPAERLNQACALGNKDSLFKLKNVKAILQSNLDKLPNPCRCKFPCCLKTMKTFAEPTVFTNH